MPTDTMIVISGVVVTFVCFALLLAWADHHSSSRG